MGSESSSAGPPAAPQSLPSAGGIHRRGVTVRSVIIGLLLLWPNAWWIYQMAVVKWNGFPTSISLFFNCILFLLGLIAINGVLRRWAPRAVLSQSELLTVYVMLNVGSCLIGHDMLQGLIPVMTHPFWMANSTNKWAELVIPHMKPWLSVSNPHALRGYFTGGDSFLAWDNLKWWLGPLAVWGLFCVVLVMSMLCLVALLRKQWTEAERLSYPLVQLPLDMTEPGGRLFRSRLMWVGFALAAGIDLWNGMAVIYRQIPAVPIKTYEITSWFSTHPWNAAGWMPIRLYPFAIGLGILLPVDMLFSCWFFFLAWKAQYVFSAAYALDAPGAPYVSEQSVGGYLGIALFALYTSRRHLGSVFRGLLDWRRDLGDREEPLPYRMAALGFLAGTLFLVAFLWMAGVALWAAITFFVIYWLLALAITRMRAELGPPAHDLSWSGPEYVLVSLTGAHQMDRGTLVGLTQMYWFNHAYRSTPMPFQLEGYRMAHDARMPLRGLSVAMFLATAVGVMAAFWAILTLCYKFGATGDIAPQNIPMLFGNESYLRLNSWLHAGPDPRLRFNTAAAISSGTLFAVLLNALRSRLVWFPLHPVGYAVSSSWSMHMLWFPLFAAWVLKVLIIRYGGRRLYVQALPLFMGMILGESVVGGLWPLAGILLDIPTYVFWPD